MARHRQLEIVCKLLGFPLAPESAADLRRRSADQFQIRSLSSICRTTSDLTTPVWPHFHPLLGDSTVGIPAYVRVDLGVTWRRSHKLEVRLNRRSTAQNDHAENHQLQNDGACAKVSAASSPSASHWRF